MISKTPSENMKKMYSQKIQTTLSKIQEAIDEIKEDNRIVTKKRTYGNYRYKFWYI